MLRTRMLKVMLCCAVGLACGTQQVFGGPRAQRTTTALTGAVGTNHPSSGQWSPVSESTWSTSTWARGATWTAGAGSTLQIGVYSANATKVILEIYGQATGADASSDYTMQKGSDGVWRAAVAQAPNATLYAFRAFGPNWPFSSSWTRGNSGAGYASDVDSSGNRFNPNKVLYDPYAHELSNDVTSAALASAGENNGMFGTGGTDVSASQTYSGPCTGNVAINRRNVDTAHYAPKSVALVDGTATGTKPSFAQKDERIYEVHLKGLTAHPSSANLTTILSGLNFPDAQNVPASLQGTYAGAAYMAGYLKDLGYTAVELLPIQDTDNDINPTTHSGGNYWGYMTYGYFAPDRHDSHDQTLGGPTREFKQMVQAFHNAGLEVWLDVVYNHTGEGGLWDSTVDAAQVVSFRGLDNQSYYALSGGTNYWVSTGTGNNFDSSKAPVKQLIQDSLAYWSSQMGVDGFRFDLAPVLGRDSAPNYNFNPNASLLTGISANASSNGYKVVAEPWDTAGSFVGQFPSGWGEWNGNYRDTVRLYMIGNLSGAGGIGYSDAFYGDYNQYNSHGGPQYTVNFIDAHDGFTLTDLVSYASKTNASRAWPFGPSDGGSDGNNSSDWGQNQTLRRQVIRNFLTFQILSRGLPMQVWGDEFGRTQNGNNNPYDVDSVATWNNYNMINTATPDAVATGDTTGGTEAYNNDLGTFSGSKNQNFAFLRYLLQLRNNHVAFRQGNYSMPIAFTRLDGSSGFNQYSDLMARIYLSGSQVGDSDFLVMSNMYTSSGTFTVPAPPSGTQWVRLIDTHNWAEGSANSWLPCSAAAISGSYGVNPQSIVVLQAIPTGACSCSTVPVTFTIANANTSYGQSVYVSGNTGALGNWAANGFSLGIQGNSANSPWTGTANLPPNSAIQYKYVKYNSSNGSAVWESNQGTSSGNRQFTTGPCGTSTNLMDGGFRF